VNTDSVEAIVARPYARVLIPDSSGCLTARVLEFPGCISEGATPAEAFDNINEALRAVVATMLDTREPIPNPFGEDAFHGSPATKGGDPPAARASA
jgi:antitoxin HicB